MFIVITGNRRTFDAEKSLGALLESAALGGMRWDCGSRLWRSLKWSRTDRTYLGPRLRHRTSGAVFRFHEFVAAFNTINNMLFRNATARSQIR